MFRFGCPDCWRGQRCKPSVLSTLYKGIGSFAWIARIACKDSAAQPSVLSALYKRFLRFDYLDTFCAFHTCIKGVVPPRFDYPDTFCAFHTCIKGSFVLITWIPSVLSTPYGSLVLITWVPSVLVVPPRFDYPDTFCAFHTV
jgi:hypothetical protein